MSTGVVIGWLEQAGLQRYASNFQGMSRDSFVNLLMQDYGKYGITDLEDKQRLFRLIKAVSKEYDQYQTGPTHVMSSRPGPQPLDQLGAELLDLDEHDGDLISPAPADVFQLSPLAEARIVEAGGSTNEEEDPPKIRVVVRKRPINKKERERGDEDIVDCLMGQGCIVVNETRQKVDLTRYIEKHQFNFDEALDEGVSNDMVYRKTVKPLVHTLFKAGKATCFAYGQTGSGKTYTMSPLPIRAAGDILQYLTLSQHQDVTLWVSCFEIYGNKVFDLLNQRKKLNILEDGKRKVVVVGLKEHNVNNVEMVKQLIEESNHRRSVGSTAANADSSRSHSIMQFALKRGSQDQGPTKLVGKISFIDLAGSERGADTFDNDRQTRLEGAEINKSLLALKECIRALDSVARHVPFRGSKLTAVLRDSFVGEQARTVMIANISPNSSSVEHTLNTLRYADRVKELRKDKADRAPGGVTPGDEAYYAPANRGIEWDRKADDLNNRRGPSRDNAPEDVDEVPNPGSFSFKRHVQVPPPLDVKVGPDCPDEDLINYRDELMNSILEEEEELITAHRLHIEESMDTVRREMNMLTEVDQPGSEIDQYVDKLEGILVAKAAGIAGLQAKLESFKRKLKEEEVMSRTVGKKWLL